MKDRRIKEVSDDHILVKYKGKEVSIDITKELQIDENTLNSQLREIPSNYAFLCLLRDEAIRKRDKLERERDFAFSKAWVYFKETDSRMSNDLATHKATSSSKFQSMDKKFLKAQDKANRLISICKAYESRERILQTISANTRKQQ